MLFPIANDAIQLTSAAPVSADQFSNGIRLKADASAAYGATSGGTQVQNGLLLDANGAVIYVDATAGLPANTQYVNGLPISSAGALCVSTGPVDEWQNGMPLAANGAISANTSGGAITSSLAFDPSSGGAANWTLTDSNKTAAIASAQNAYVFTPIFKSTGKWFTVIRIVDFASPTDSKGYAICSNVGAPPSAYAIGGSGGALFLGGISGTMPTFSAGLGIDVDIYIAFDVDAKKAWIGAGSLPGDPAAGTGNNLSWAGVINIGIAGYSNNNGSVAVKFNLPSILPSAPPIGFTVLE
jgi:hypothetical protein